MLHFEGATDVLPDEDELELEVVVHSQQVELSRHDASAT